MRINCKNITIELKNKIKNDFDIETDVINLDDAYYDTIVLFTKYYNEDSASKDVFTITRIDKVRQRSCYSNGRMDNEEDDYSTERETDI